MITLFGGLKISFNHDKQSIGGRVYPTATNKRNKTMNTEILKAASNLGIKRKHIKDSLIGRFDTDSDFAQYYFEEIKGNNRETEEWPYCCIDWDAAGKYLLNTYHIKSGNYYFFNL